MDALTDVLMGLASSDWIYPLAAVLARFDALFPPIPSETIVIAAASLGAATGAPHGLLLGACAALGAFAGDALTYALGRAVGTTRYGWMRRGRVRRAIEAAARGLDRGGASAIFVARYIPVGRVAVNLTAGATGFALRRFLPLSLAACVTWAGYSVWIGHIAGSMLANQPLLGAAVGVGLAIVMGFAVDRVRARLRRRQPSSSAAATSTGTQPSVVRKTVSRATMRPTL
jgi:membrane protein DedA with SNARE-associated domain